MVICTEVIKSKKKSNTYDKIKGFSDVEQVPSDVLVIFQLRFCWLRYVILRKKNETLQLM